MSKPGRKPITNPRRMLSVRLPVPLLLKLRSCGEQQTSLIENALNEYFQNHKNGEMK